jgi:hypothetical protein
MNQRQEPAAEAAIDGRRPVGGGHLLLRLGLLGYLAQGGAAHRLAVWRRGQHRRRVPLVVLVVWWSHAAAAPPHRRARCRPGQPESALTNSISKSRFGARRETLIQPADKIDSNRPAPGGPGRDRASAARPSSSSWPTAMGRGRDHAADVPHADGAAVLPADGLVGRTRAGRLTRNDWLGRAGAGRLRLLPGQHLDFAGLQYITASLERLILYLTPRWCCCLAGRCAAPIGMPAGGWPWRSATPACVLVFGRRGRDAGRRARWPGAPCWCSASAVSYAHLPVLQRRIRAAPGRLRLVGLASAVACVCCIAQFLVLQPLGGRRWRPR